MHARAGGDQPAFHDLLKETVRNEPFTVNTAQVVGPKHTSPALLKRFQHIEGFSQFLIRRRHRTSPVSDEHKFIVLCEYKYITPYQCKSIMPYECKYIMHIT